MNEVLTQKNLKRYKTIDSLIKILSDSQRTLKKEFIEALTNGEVPEMGELTISLTNREKRTLSKDKIVKVFSDILVESKIKEKLESIPKTEYQMLSVDFIVDNPVFKARVETEIVDTVESLLDYEDAEEVVENVEVK